MLNGRPWLPVVIAAVALAGCSTCASRVPVARDTPATSSRQSSSAIGISTSTWRPGDPGRTARIRGVLRFDPGRCPYLVSEHSRLWVVWPAGYGAQVAPTGEGVLVTADGEQIREGALVEAGGAIAGNVADEGMACIEKGATFSVVESALQVTPPR
jgi:hypothetical protein